MSETVTVAYNAVTAKLVGASDEAQSKVRAALSYMQAGAEHTAAFKAHRWDGRSTFFDNATQTFPRGFVQYVHVALSKAGFQVRMVKKLLPEPLGPEDPVVDEFGNGDPRYDYQPETVRLLLRHGQMIAQIATGGGKSRIAQMAVARINRPTLFLTTRSVLMYQMAKKFKKMGKKVAILGDGSLQVSKEVTCAMTQSVAAWLKDPDPEKTSPGSEKYEKQRAKQKKMIEILSRFELVILEEAHEVSGESFFDIMRNCVNAHYRLALTATPFMKDDEEANMRLMASSGHVGIQVSEKLLIDRGILAKPYFKYIELRMPAAKLYRSTPWQRAVELGIVHYDYRNKCIAVEAMRAARYKLTTMILVGRKEHGALLEDVLTRAGMRVEFIQGSDDQDEREAALARLGRGDIDVLIGTNILDVGVDVPSVGVIVLAGGGKAEVALRQRIGRGLRAKKFGPNVAFVADFADTGNTHLNKHYKTRKALVESTPGFGENIVDDFDYAGMGFTRADAVC
ncbi:DEAD/DEAH box helicase [Castellaniella sp.]|uniref:DEAD/DEAH box helicase n=1 Tax=Castellaniella sp. TaxID=1955812 RepID=UPI002AFE035E|nr:DEAD/DEAH box helicase [Castellaniella sp.]